MASKQSRKKLGDLTVSQLNARHISKKNAKQQEKNLKHEEDDQSEQQEEIPEKPKQNSNQLENTQKQKQKLPKKNKQHISNEKLLRIENFDDDKSEPENDERGMTRGAKSTERDVHGAFSTPIREQRPISTDITANSSTSKHPRITPMQKIFTCMFIHSHCPNLVYLYLFNQLKS